MMSKQLDAVRTTIAASQAAGLDAAESRDVILQLSSAAQQLLLTLALAAPWQWGTRPRKTRGRPLMYQRGHRAILFPTMSAYELHNQLLELHAERAVAEETGVAKIQSYMDDLERDIARSPTPRSSAPP